MLSSSTSSLDAASPYSSALLEQLDALDLEYSEHGASLKILQQYDQILSSLNQLKNKDTRVMKKVSQTLLKHGLINLRLNRDRPAMEDFDLCTREEFNKECFDQYVKLFLDYGKVDQIEDKLTQFKGQIPKSEANRIQSQVDQVKDLEKKVSKPANGWSFHHSDEPIQQCERLIQLSKHNSVARRAHIRCIKEMREEEMGLTEKMNKLTTDYFEMTKGEDGSMDDFSKLSLLYLFGERPSVVRSNHAIKGCLKLDNSNNRCRQLSKVMLKLGELLSLMNEISDYYSFVYGDRKSEELYKVRELEPSREQWSRLKSLLFDPDNKVRFKNRKDETEVFGFNIAKCKNNFEILTEFMLNELEEDFGFKQREVTKGSKFARDLFIMAKECYFQTDDWENSSRNGPLDNKYYKRYLKEQKKSDLIDQLLKLDRLLDGKKYKEAKRELANMEDGMKMTRMVKERYDRYNKEMKRSKQQQQRKHQERRQRQQRQQQQQQQQQQQRQQQQRFHQQQQQQQQVQKTPPNDYYKILGVKKGADEATIKKAYREKMKQNHPDKLKRTSNLTDEEIESKVSEINNAYEVLSDPEKRKNYDSFGEDPNDPSYHQQHNTRQAQREGDPNMRFYRNPKNSYQFFGGMGNQRFQQHMNFGNGGFGTGGFGTGGFSRMFKQGFQNGRQRGKGPINGRTSRGKKSANGNQRRSKRRSF
ncbi:hypothetical protein FOA43_004759 [Brettanomyces nanus]|uniref:J domain-containing protein n=1 Tax=Eeniella nana TaxID=13502 RepID=A0A875S8Y8_EENNA|nr:uncharacterized protein FOA43_004759 [Brettanomyces nanus]QPG77348.1 hypothetical protein FOA43_004759 [Brettanomyces nanus]